MSMKLEYNLENIGNIDKASITIKQLTIIAGENSSGKTFVTKSLYTVLNSIYQNHLYYKLSSQFTRIISRFRYLDRELGTLSKKDLEFQEKNSLDLEKIELFIDEIYKCNFEEQDIIITKNIDFLIDYRQYVKSYFEDRLKTKKFQKNKHLIRHINSFILGFEGILLNRVEIITDSIASSLEVGLKKNFQVTKLSSIINYNSNKKLKLGISNLGKIEVDKSEEISFDFTAQGIQQIQKVQNIVFFDSPVYVKIRKAIEKKNKLRVYNPFEDDDKYLKGYPDYIDNLYNFIDEEYIDIADFSLISQEIQEKILGKLDISRSGDITYIDDKGNKIPLSLTAMGISNIGLIDLLLRNNIINKGSFLIMDEPEVHLHPQWQVFLAQILYKIAKSGANIIIATHSLDFLKAFENILKEENKLAEDIIAINKMPYDKEFSKLSELEKIGIVLDDLSRPFYNLYMQDI